MTEPVERVDSKRPATAEESTRPPKGPPPTRLSEPDWVDWCDADR